ncbi:MAG: 4Fe-4S dicluster-binding protein [Terriglobales bacterium]
MGQLFAVEIIYRGVFQKTLAKNICRGIVLAAHNEGRPGISFGRYGDSPERNGIPAKSFAIVASDDETLENGMAQYEPKATDITIVLDDTLCKGIESWAWYGVQPVNGHVKPGATLIVVSQQDASGLLKLLHKRETPYKLAALKGIASFSGMWVYKDDHTDVRVLGAIAKALPELMKFASLEKYISEKLKNPVKLASAKAAYDRFHSIAVNAGQGNGDKPITFAPLKWKDMREGVSIAGQPQGGPYADPVTKEKGGFRPVRNDKLKKFSTRTMRPVVNFATCTKCTLCWLNCPDGSFDVAPDGTYDANLEACCGCGICEAVCPVQDCITMVHESVFTDAKSQWEAFRKDKTAYAAYLKKVTAEKTGDRTHGFRFKGQYKEQAAAALDLVNKG